MVIDIEFLEYKDVNSAVLLQDKVRNELIKGNIFPSKRILKTSSNIFKRNSKETIRTVKNRYLKRK